MNDVHQLHITFFCSIWGSQALYSEVGLDASTKLSTAPPRPNIPKPTKPHQAKPEVSTPLDRTVAIQQHHIRRSLKPEEISVIAMAQAEVRFCFSKKRACSDKRHSRFWRSQKSPQFLLDFLVLLCQDKRTERIAWVENPKQSPFTRRSPEFKGRRRGSPLTRHCEGVQRPRQSLHTPLLIPRIGKVGLPGFTMQEEWE